MQTLHTQAARHRPHTVAAASGARPPRPHLDGDHRDETQRGPPNSVGKKGPDICSQCAARQPPPTSHAHRRGMDVPRVKKQSRFVLKAWKSTAGLLPAQGRWTAARGVWVGKTSCPQPGAQEQGQARVTGNGNWMGQQESYSETAILRRAGGRGPTAPSTHSPCCTKTGILKAGARGPLLLWLPPELFPKKH